MKVIAAIISNSAIQIKKRLIIKFTFLNFFVAFVHTIQSHEQHWWRWRTLRSLLGVYLKQSILSWDSRMKQIPPGLTLCVKSSKVYHPQLIMRMIMMTHFMGLIVILMKLSFQKFMVNVILNLSAFHYKVEKISNFMS